MNEYVNEAMAMFQKVIAAATPIAQKAWEISMLTLQIDALSALVLLVVGAIGCVIGLRVVWLLHKRIVANGMNAGWEPLAYLCVILPASIGMVVVLIQNAYAMCNAWLWVKLFKPELWLAHMAIEKLIK